MELRRGNKPHPLWKKEYLHGMHFWFWFFSLLAALVAWRQECVSTLQAVCNKEYERANKNCTHQVPTLYAS